jgi:GNAT superfamily N-acetyltransferase
MQNFEIIKDNIKVSTNKNLLDLDTIYDYLHNQSYWAKTRSFELVKKSTENSVCFGLYDNNIQIGFARVITDFSVFAFILDLFIIDEHKGKGLGKFLFESIMKHPDFEKKILWSLITKDAHGLYRKYGFTELLNPSLWMQLDKRDKY